MLDNFQVNSTKKKVVILHACVHCSLLQTEIHWNLSFLAQNLRDFETQILKIQDLKMVQTPTSMRFQDTNFKLREFETRLIFFETRRFL